MPKPPDPKAEKKAALTSMLAAAAARIRAFIVIEPPELNIIRLGELCLSPTFANDLTIDTITSVYKVLKGGPHPHRVAYLSRCGEEALLQNINDADPYALKRAITYGCLAVYLLDKDMPERGTVISVFGRTLRQLWNREQKDEQLDDAIYYFQKTVEIESVAEENRTLHFDDLARALMKRYKKLHDNKDFEEARTHFEEATTCEHDATPAFWSGLGQLFLEKARYEKPMEAIAFDESIAMFGKALGSITTQFRGPVADIHYQLGLAHKDRYLVSEDDEDWNRAVESFDDTMARLVPHLPNSRSIAYNMGRVYSDISGRYGRLRDSIKAEECYRLALGPKSENITALASLAEELRYRASYTGSQGVLNESVELIDTALTSTLPTDTDFLFRLGRCSAAYMERFTLFGDEKDIDWALSLLWECLDASAGKMDERAKILENLSCSLILRHEKTGDNDDLQNAEASIRSALGFEDLQPNDQIIMVQRFRLCDVIAPNLPGTVKLCY